MAIKHWKADLVSSTIGFGITHFGLAKVRGRFTDFQVSIAMEEERFESAQVYFEAQAASIDTFDRERNQHLCGADFFAVDQYPTLKFKASNVISKTASNYILEGDLEIKKIAKPVSLQARFSKIITDPWGNKRCGLMMHTKINRTDWGLNFSKKLANGLPILSKSVDITIDLELI